MQGADIGNANEATTMGAHAFTSEAANAVNLDATAKRRTLYGRMF